MLTSNSSATARARLAARDSFTDSQDHISESPLSIDWSVRSQSFEKVAIARSS